MRPGDEVYADSVAFEFFSLILDGDSYTLYTQLMSGCIDWQADVVAADSPAESGSFTPPANWQELSNAILDLLMPSNAVEDAARRLANFKMEAHENVSSYALRFRSLVTRFESSVKRATPGVTPWASLSTIIWQNGLSPSIQCQQLSEKPVTSFREAVERGRRHEAAGFVGGVSAMSFTRVPNRAAVHHQQRQDSNNGNSKQQRRNQGRNDNRRRHSKQQQSGGRGASSTSNDGDPERNDIRNGKPYCVWSQCNQPIGHFEHECHKKARLEGRKPDYSRASWNKHKRSKTAGNNKKQSKAGGTGTGSDSE